MVGWWYRDPQQRDVVALASHNAYPRQGVKLTQRKMSRAIERFDAGSGQWKPVASSGGETHVTVPPAAVELLRFAK